MSNARINSGVLTIEAAIVVPLIMMIIVSTLMTSKIYITFNSVEKALTKVSYDVSNSGYILKDLGLIDISVASSHYIDNTDVDDKMKEFETKSKSLMSASFSEEGMTTELIAAVNQLKGAKDVSSFINAINGLKQSVSSAYVIVKDALELGKEIFAFLSDSKTYKEAGILIGTELFQGVKDYLGKLYVDKAMEMYYPQGYYANSLDIISDISYEGSRFFVPSTKLDLNETIVVDNVSMVVANYTLKIPFLIDLGFGEMNLKNSVTMRGYVGDTDV